MVSNSPISGATSPKRICYNTLRSQETRLMERILWQQGDCHGQGNDPRHQDGSIHQSDSKKAEK